MENRFPLWKNLLVITVVAIGILFSLPNLYGQDPSIQISAQRNEPLNESTLESVNKSLSKTGLEPLSATLGENSILVRFKDTVDQLKAADFIKDELGTGYTVALNLAPATPEWLRALHLEPMFLGLDLRGGVHFLLDVDMPAAIRQAEERYTSDIRSALRNAKVRYLAVKKDRGTFLVQFEDRKNLDAALKVFDDELRNLDVASKPSELTLSATIPEREAREIRKFALEQNITTLRNRINELGVAEPIIQQQGDHRIVVQLPGVQDTTQAKDILGATATLEFRMVDVEHDLQKAVEGHAPIGSRIYHERNGNPVLLQRSIIVTGDQIVDASSGLDQQNGSPAVFISLNGVGANKMAKTTQENIGKPMAVVFIENKVLTVTENGRKVRKKTTVEEVINVATIRDSFSKRFQITGLDSTKEARNLALLLRAGALAAPVEIVEERTIGPSLGKDNIDKGMVSALVGFVLVVIFMGFYYKLFGVIANIALAMNVVLIVAILSVLQATLTLPGIAGIVLTVGMAVDANVLIHERIREEIRSGNTPQSSIYFGYDRAFATIFDSNITTLIAAAVLFGFGTGPVKGFAVTLTIGIITSMFTAITGTRMLINLIYGNKRVKKLSI
ncbi:MAG: protein translocase subunit SecD [Methylococcaceae bacterium]|nr:protein translocase subunit SecD [Methylococcaceae bacterium]MCI0734174.1 protein translocase subunit SecD [Methylococcaceae bacterium]